MPPQPDYAREMEPPVSVDRYLILDRSRSKRGIACWWRANESGYTENLDWAGRYTLEQAEMLVSRGMPDTEMWLESEVLGGRVRRIIDLGDAGNRFLWEQRRNGDWLIKQKGEV